MGQGLVLGPSSDCDTARCLFTFPRYDADDQYDLNGPNGESNCERHRLTYCSASPRLELDFPNIMGYPALQAAVLRLRTRRYSRTRVIEALWAVGALPRPACVTASCTDCMSPRTFCLDGIVKCVQ